MHLVVRIFAYWPQRQYAASFDKWRMRKLIISSYRIQRTARIGWFTITKLESISRSELISTSSLLTVTVFRFTKPGESHEETEETFESSSHRSRCVGMIGLALNALISKQGLLLWSLSTVTKQRHRRARERCKLSAFPFCFPSYSHCNLAWSPPPPPVPFLFLFWLQSSFRSAIVIIQP